MARWANDCQPLTSWNLQVDALNDEMFALGWVISKLHIREVQVPLAVFEFFGLGSIDDLGLRI